MVFEAVLGFSTEGGGSISWLAHVTTDAIMIQWQPKQFMVMVMAMGSVMIVVMITNDAKG